MLTSIHPLLFKKNIKVKHDIKFLKYKRLLNKFPFVFILNDLSLFTIFLLKNLHLYRNETMKIVLTKANLFSAFIKTSCFLNYEINLMKGHLVILCISNLKDMRVFFDFFYREKTNADIDILFCIFYKMVFNKVLAKNLYLVLKPMTSVLKIFLLQSYILRKNIIKTVVITQVIKERQLISLFV